MLELQAGKQCPKAGAQWLSSTTLPAVNQPCRRAMCVLLFAWGPLAGKARCPALLGWVRNVKDQVKSSNSSKPSVCRSSSSVTAASRSQTQPSAGKLLVEQGPAGSACLVSCTSAKSSAGQLNSLHLQKLPRSSSLFTPRNAANLSS